jgi:hypothetical protein
MKVQIFLPKTVLGLEKLGKRAGMMDIIFA